MAQSTTTKKKGSFRRNVIVTFMFISVVSLGITGAVSWSFVNLIGDFTTTESSTALQEQIGRNMNLTAEQTALVINQKLTTAESMVLAMAEECEWIFDDDATFAAREVYYDYFFDNPLDGPTPSDLAWDESREVFASFTYSSWYAPPSISTNYLTYENMHNETLSRISNLDYLFQYIHDQMSEFRWLYVAFRNDIFINYPGSIVGGSNDDRLDPGEQFWCASEPWYEAIRDGQGQIVYDGPYFDPIDNVLLLSIGRAFYHPENGTLMGIVAGDITVDDIKDKILDVRVLETGKASLLTSDGTIVAHHEVNDSVYTYYGDDLPPIADFEALETAQIVQITSGQTGIIEYQDGTRDMVLAYAPVGIGPGNGYICIVIVPVEEALAAIPVLEGRIVGANAAAISFILAVTVGGIILAGVVAATVSNSITKPLQYLMDLAMRNVEAMIKQQDLTQLDLRVETEYIDQEDEIGELARAFQGMLDTIGDDEE